ncbi:MAG TPA: DUF1206 domain-containing protein [Nocardioidaceae bacterium]|nr:DUF1206 domain-containing protein [Nocardioidaceae bacterium]
MTSKSMSTSAEARATARAASDSKWFEHAVRVGLVAFGVIHILVGWLALQLAFGDRGGAPNQQGALHILARQPGGELLLWITGVGLLFLALWQLTEATWGHTKDDGGTRARNRVTSAGKTVLYAVLGYSAIKTATAGSSKSNEDSLTRKLLDLPLGQAIVVAIGVVIGIVAAAHIKRGITTSFEERLQPGALGGSSGAVVKRLGQIGYVAKGVALAVLGGMFIWAGATYDADEAGGLDTALHTLLDASAGPWLLAVVAAGIIAFGLYCFAWARYADTRS